MKVRDIMHRGVIKIDSNATIFEAAKIMSEKDTGSILIEEKDKLGILTERDLLKKIVAKGLDVKKMKVRDIMTSQCYTVEHDVSIEEANRIMHEKNIRRLPVTENGKLVGMITNRDISKSLPFFYLKKLRKYEEEK